VQQVAHHIDNQKRRSSNILTSEFFIIKT
jgi:hypothetical protein